MSKRRKKKKQQTAVNKKTRQNPTPKPQSATKILTEVQIDELEQKLDDSLRKFAYQNAVKCARKLHTLDQSKYQSSFIRALQGYYQELNQKQQHKRAAVILEQIKTLTSPDAADFIELKTALLNGSVKPQHINTASAKLLKFIDESFPESEKNIVIDILLTAPELPEIKTDDSAIQQLICNITAVRSAFNLISDKDYEKSIKETASIKHKSLLAPWRLLIKGICAYYTGEDEKALTSFKKLPVNSSPAQIAKAYLFLLNDKECVAANGKKDIFLKSVAKLTTTDQDMANRLPRAEILWKTGRFRDSLEKIRPLFKDYSLNSSADRKRLLRFYCNSIFTLIPEQLENYLHKLAEVLLPSKRAFTPPLLQAAFFRIAALVEEKIFKQIDEPVESWKLFLEVLAQAFDPGPKFTAAVITYQATIYTSENAADDRDFSRFFQNLSSAPEDMFNNFTSYDKRAEELYLNALSIDPNNLETNLQLLDFYNSSGSQAKSKTIHLLDDLIIKFPQEKKILYQAGLACVNRKAFVKGLKYLRQTSALDPSDKDVKIQILIGSIDYAWKLATKNNLEKWRKLFTEVLTDYCLPGLCNLNLSPATLRARWAVLELYNDQFDESKKQLALAQSADNSLPPDTITYFFWIYANIKKLQTKLQPDYKKKIKSIFSSNIDINIAIIFSNILLYSKLIIGQETPFIKKEVKRVNQLFNKLKGSQTTPSECLAIVKHLLDPSNENYKLALTYLKRTHKQYPEEFNVWLKKISIEIDCLNSAYHLTKKIKELKLLITQARSSPKNQMNIINEAEELLGMCEYTIDNYYGMDRVKMKDTIDDILTEMENEMEDTDDDEYFEPMPLPPGATKPPKNWPRRRKQ